MSPPKATSSPSRTTVTSEDLAIFGRPTLFFALALSLGVLGIYLFTLSNNFSPDSMAFAVLATRGQLDEPLFFQAEHLLHPFAGWLWYQMWLFFGYKQGALAPMQVLSAMGGAAGVGFFFLSLRLLLGSSQRAMVIGIACTLLLAGSYGYWYHSTEAEDQIVSNALVLGAFLLLVMRVAETKQSAYSLTDSKKHDFRSKAISVIRSRATLVSTMSLAILFHGTAVLFLPGLLLGLWLIKRDVRSALVVIVGVVAVVGVALMLVGGLAHGLRSPGEFSAWLLAAPGVGVWGRFSPRSLWTGAQTMANAVVFLQGGPGFKALLGGLLSWRNVLSVLLFLGFWTLALLVPLYLLRIRRYLDGRRAIAGVCIAWFAVFGLFNLYWAPEDIQFWVQLAPPLIVGLSVAYVDIVSVMKPREELLTSLFLFGLTSVFVINLITAIVPRANLAMNAGLRKSACLGQTTGPDDLIITPGWDWASSYVPYFTERQLLSIVDTYLLSAGSDRAKLLSIMDERIGETVAQGGQVYVVRLYNLDQNDSAWLKRTTGLTAEDFSFKRKQVWECGGEVVWEVVRQ